MKRQISTLQNIISCFSLLWITNVCFADTKPIKVTVKQMTQQDWMLEYQLPKAVEQVSFYREGDLARSDWTLLKDNLVFVAESSTRTLIKSVDGTLFDRFKIQFNSNFDHLDKDYELNQAFSDGGLTLYTGHLLLSINEEAIEHQFKFMPRKDNHSIVKGKVSSIEQDWLDSDFEGTYVYFGSTQPLKTKHMVAVLDQQLPEWIREEMMSALPKIYAYYTEQFKVALNETPMILFSYKNTEESGTQYSGGALPGVIQLNLTGKDWQQKSKENLSGFLHFIAHEAAHLWNAQMLELSGDNTESWIHEGGAEAVSLKALLMLDVYQPSDVSAANEKYLNECIDGLKLNSVTDFEKHKNFRAFYSCGAVIAWLSEKVMQTKQANTDLFDLWADLIQRINANNLQLTTEQYLKSLLLLSDDTKTIANIITLLTEPQVRPIEFFMQVFKEAGIQIKANNKHPNKAQQAIQTTIKHLMMIDCKTYSFENHKDYYTVGNIQSCNSLKPGMKITEIAGLEVKNKGHEIYNKVQESCKDNKLIQLQTQQKQKINIACNNPMPVLTPWLALGS